MEDLVRKRIKGLRQSKGWSQREIAEKLQISQPAYQKLESGRTKLGLRRLQQISQLFELRPDDLLQTDQH